MRFRQPGFMVQQELVRGVGLVNLRGWAEWLSA